MDGAERERRMDQMLDRHEIHQVILRLARGTDRRDSELIRSCYHEDSFDDHGAFQGTGAEFAEWVPPTLAIFTTTQHFIGSPRIDFEGDGANSETYCVAHHLLPEDDSDGPRDSVMALRYVDRFERARDGDWLIRKRVCVWDFTYIVPAGDRWPYGEDYVLGQPNRGDPTYSR
jgi:hypothetical protein